MIGLDTGFFVKFLMNSEEAVQVWETIIDGEEASVSCLTLFELKRLSLKGKIDTKSTETLLAGITSVCRVIWLDNEDILLQGSSLSHGLGIPAIDSLILAGFIKYNTEIIYTTDRHLELYCRKGTKVIRLM
ncbi:MAG TPA: type II toxin-antitoxin system VapC family toxin [bacterium]|nr:type II toxin-antitoxin system VapC family toxin [bacterium]